MDIKDGGVILSKNTFMKNGICEYSDVYKNVVFAKRLENDRFVVKLRFANKDITSNPIYVDPHNLDESDGTYLHIDCKNGASQDSEENQSGIQMLTFIIQRWIGMFKDIRFLQTDNEMLMRMNKELSVEDIYAYKVSNLTEYEELNDVIRGVFGGSAQMVSHT